MVETSAYRLPLSELGTGGICWEHQEITIYFDKSSNIRDARTRRRSPGFKWHGVGKIGIQTDRVGVVNFTLCGSKGDPEKMPKAKRTTRSRQLLVGRRKSAGFQYRERLGKRVH